MTTTVQSPAQPEPQENRPDRAILNRWQTGELSAEQAQADLITVLKQAQAQTDPELQAHTETSLGILNGYQANYSASIIHFEAARQLHEQNNNQRGVASADLNLGETYRLLGNFTRARLYFHQAYETAKTIDNIATQAMALGNEGQMWISLRSTRKALTTLEQSLHLSQTPWENPETAHQRIVRLDHICELLVALVTVAISLKDPERAWQYAQEAYTLAEQLQRPLRLGFANRAVADAITVLDNTPGHDFSNNPDVYYDEALNAFRRISAESEIGKTLLAQGHSLAKRGKQRAAGPLFQQAMVIFTRLGMTDDAAKAAEAQLGIY